MSTKLGAHQGDVMKKDIKLAVVSAIIGSIASLALGSTFGFIGKKANVAITDAQVLQAVEKLSKNNKFITGIREGIKSCAHEYDSGWFSLRNDQTVTKDTKFNSLPSTFVAYYKTEDGDVFPWGLNQYGDAFQSNGALLNFDNSGKLYVRTPSPSPASKGKTHRGYILHVGAYRNKDDTGVQEIFRVKNVEFRIIACK